jgi:hypothetical protein
MATTSDELLTLSNIARFEGWVPVRIYESDGGTLVDWCFLGERAFREATFAQTIEECLHYPANLLLRHQTSLDVLREVSETQPSLKPNGFVFHMSRSGASQVSRLLASLPQNIIISRASTVDSILRSVMQSRIQDGTRAHSNELKDHELLRCLLRVLGQPRRGTEQHLVIVFSAWNILELAVVRRAFPDVPWVFLYREPVAALDSQMKQRNPVTIPGVFPPSAFGLSADAATALEPEEYCAAVLAALCRVPLQQPGDAGMLINYSQLPEVVWTSMSRLFGVDLSGRDQEALQALATGQKSSASSLVQQATGSKSESYSERLQKAAQSFLFPVFEELEAARLGSARR